MEIKIFPKNESLLNHLDVTVVTAEEGEYKRIYQISGEIADDPAFNLEAWVTTEFHKAFSQLDKQMFTQGNSYKSSEIITAAQMNTSCDCADEPKEKDTYVCQYCRQLNWINDLSCTSCGGEQG